MGRALRFPPDSILDAARAVVTDRGVRQTTVSAIAAASRAPVGSIYHRFESIDELLARLWIRAVRRSQAAALDPAVLEEEPLPAAVAAALGTYDFCVAEPEDARLLAVLRREDFLERELPEQLHRELRTLNDPALAGAKELARGLFGRADSASVDLVLAATVDVPYGLARPYLEASSTPPRGRRARLPDAVRTMLT
jgi:AcrR family transcriptional regulator